MNIVAILLLSNILNGSSSYEVNCLLPTPCRSLFVYRNTIEVKNHLLPLACSNLHECKRRVQHCATIVNKRFNKKRARLRPRRPARTPMWNQVSAGVLTCQRAEWPDPYVDMHTHDVWRRATPCGTAQHNLIRMLHTVRNRAVWPDPYGGMHIHDVCQRAGLIRYAMAWLVLLIRVDVLIGTTNQGRRPDWYYESGQSPTNQGIGPTFDTWSAAIWPDLYPSGLIWPDSRKKLPDSRHPDLQIDWPDSV